MSPPHEPVVITGCGWVTPFAAGDVAGVLSALPSSRTDEDQPAFCQVPEAVLGDCAGIPAESRKEKVILIASVALGHALRSAGVDRASLNAERVGVAVGCALAGQIGMIDFAEDVRAQSARFVSPIRFPQTVGNYPAGALARGFGIRGPSITLACGTAGGIEAVREGAAWLAAGTADIVIAGGVEVFTAPLAAGLMAGVESDGGFFADAACLFILERATSAHSRNAMVLAEMIRGAERPALPSTLEGAETRSGSPPADVDSVVSVAGHSAAAGFGAIYMEAWTGRSLAASGAAALAGAIGWSMGHAAPSADGEPVVCESKPDESISRRERSVVLARDLAGPHACISLRFAQQFN